MILVKTLTHSDLAPLIRAARRLAAADEAWRKHGLTSGRKRRIQGAVQAMLSAAGDVHEKLFADSREGT